jgi:hypothetical protein
MLPDFDRWFDLDKESGARDAVIVWTRGLFALSRSEFPSPPDEATTVLSRRSKRLDWPGKKEQRSPWNWDRQIQG